MSTFLSFGGIATGGAGPDFMVAIGSGASAMDVILRGGSGNDYLISAAGNNRVNGGDGNDMLVSGPGSDVMIGGGQDDTFTFLGHDIITDFAANPVFGLDHFFHQDKILLGLGINETNFANRVLISADGHGGTNVAIRGTLDSVDLLGVVPAAVTRADFIF